MDTQTSSARFRLGFIGAGRLSSAVMRGLLRAHFCETGELIASRRDEEARSNLKAELGIELASDNRQVARESGVVLLGVKPGQVLAVVDEVAAEIRGKLVISLAAGIRLEQLEARAEARFIRVMTNLPCAIGRGASAFAVGTRASESDVARVREIFSAVGIIVPVDEDAFEAVTGLAGSGPAFVYSVIEALAAGGTRAGLPNEISLQLAAQTTLGAAELLIATKSAPAKLRDEVVTKGGTTAAGLEVMRARDVAAGLSAAVEAAAVRGRELA